MISYILLCFIGFLLADESINIPKAITAGDPSKFMFHESFKNISSASTSSDWVMYKQCDSRWGGNQLGYCAGTNVCAAGCAMSSVAMMLASKGVGLDPGSLNSWLISNGGYADGCDIIWSVPDRWGVTSFQGIETANESEICNGLAQGHGIIANVMNGGHWVLLTGIYLLS